MSANNYTNAELTRFRKLQRLAYDVVEQVGEELTGGVTEREAAARVREVIGERGVTQFFHTPFAWFGDRTRFHGIKTPLYFFPTGRKLERGMPFILDVAPIRDGYAADIGYTSALGHNALLEVLERNLLIIRDEILTLVRAERTLQEIYEEVDRTIVALGCDNVHTEYPFHVLGHRVGKMPLAGMPSIHAGGFDLRTAAWLFGRHFGSMLPNRHETPFWNQSRRAAVRAEPGLWALEPHIGKGDVGAKWEEILVVTESDAYWLDDDLPHTRSLSEREGELGLAPLDEPPDARGAASRRPR